MEVTKQLTVKQIRAMLHMTQEEMAKAVGINPNTYKVKEADRGKWTVLEVALITRYTGIDASAIRF